MKTILAAMTSLLPYSRGGVILASTLCLAPSVADGSGYCRVSYPVRERIVEKVVVKEVQKVVYALQTIPLYSLAYTPTAITSSYQTVVAPAQQTAYYAQPYALPVAQVYQPYAQPLYQQPQAVVQKSCDEKLAEFRLEIRKEIRLALSGNADVPERLPLKLNGGGNLFVKRCASCHDDSDKAAKGDGYVLFKAGEVDGWDATTRENVLSQLVRKKMPKFDKLTPEEFSEAVTLLDEMRKAETAKPVTE